MVKSLARMESPRRAQGRPPLRRLQSLSKDPESNLSFMLVTNDNAEILNYDPDQTYMVSYAISEQTSPRTKLQSLGEETTLSCCQVQSQITEIRI